MSLSKNTELHYKDHKSRHSCHIYWWVVCSHVALGSASSYMLGTINERTLK